MSAKFPVTESAAGFRRKTSTLSCGSTPTKALPGSSCATTRPVSNIPLFGGLAPDFGIWPWTMESIDRENTRHRRSWCQTVTSTPTEFMPPSPRNARLFRRKSRPMSCRPSKGTQTMAVRSNPPVERDRLPAQPSGSLRRYAAPAAPHLARWASL